MNGSQALLSSMVETLQSKTDLSSSQVNVVICPPFPYIGFLKKITDGVSIDAGSQNVHTEASGAYTGEISVSMLQEWKVQYGIVGHSERRAYNGETDELVNQKSKVLLGANITPVICIGESLEQREEGVHETTVIAQLNAALAGMSEEEIKSCVIAYEPIWAIGTGKTASNEQANQMHEVIRTRLVELTDADSAKKISILYGGSVNAKNSGELLGQPEIDGALVGGASLKPDDFSQIVNSCL